MFARMPGESNTVVPPLEVGVLCPTGIRSPIPSEVPWCRALTWSARQWRYSTQFSNAPSAIHCRIAL